MKILHRSTSLSDFALLKVFYTEYEEKEDDTIIISYTKKGVINTS